MFSRCDVRLWRGLFKVKIVERLNGSCRVEALEDYDMVRKGDRFETFWINLYWIVKADGLEDEWKCPHTGWR